MNRPQTSTSNSTVREPASTDTKKTGVLLLHGLTGMPSEMRPVQKHLLRQGFKVSVPLLPGHGGSHKELLASNWQSWLKGAKAALDELYLECDKVIVGGLSMGSLLSVALAAQDKRVSGIVLLSTTLKYDGYSIPRGPVWSLLTLCKYVPVFGHHLFWTESPPYGLKDQRLQKKITEAVEAAKRGESNHFGLFRTYGGSLVQLGNLVEHVKKVAPQVECPSFIVHATEDSMTSVRNAHTIHGLLGCAQKTMSFIDGCDHVLTLDLQKHEVARQFGEFVNSIHQNKRFELSASENKGSLVETSPWSEPVASPANNPEPRYNDLVAASAMAGSIIAEPA